MTALPSRSALLTPADPDGPARAIRIHPDDSVAILTAMAIPGRRVHVQGGNLELDANQTIPPGHKIALTPVAAGQPVRRYGQIIGFATQDIRPGDHVHTHNLAFETFRREYAFGTEVKPMALVPETERRTFMGYRRDDGRVGTRNTVLLIASVNCSAHTTRVIAERARQELLPDFPHVDDVVAITHKGGCGTRSGGPEIELLQRTLSGFARHPNVAGYLLIGLGCEINQIADMVENQGLLRPALPGEGRPLPPPILTIQGCGGIEPTVEAGLRAVAELLPQANECRRTPQPASRLIVGLECGGSDAYSGVTANPALGLAADRIVAQGGTAVLAETPEIYGAEHLLVRRAVSEAVGRRLIERVRWWEEYTARHGFVIDNNPTPGNKAGGLTTIYEKSLGAVAKGGSTPLTAVYEYAEPITTPGFGFMDTPGYDPPSVTGMVAGGANVIVFTTGRGSVFGFKPVPSIKIASTTQLARHMAGDIDIDAGVVLDGTPLETVGEAIFEEILAVASGKPTKSEAQGVGEEEFNPWILGPTV